MSWAFAAEAARLSPTSHISFGPILLVAPSLELASVRGQREAGHAKVGGRPFRKPASQPMVVDPAVNPHAEMWIFSLQPFSPKSLM
jgi:hypothetical protein